MIRDAEVAELGIVLRHSLAPKGPLPIPCVAFLTNQTGICGDARNQTRPALGGRPLLFRERVAPCLEFIEARMSTLY